MYVIFKVLNDYQKSLLSRIFWLIVICFGDFNLCVLALKMITNSTRDILLKRDYYHCCKNCLFLFIHMLITIIRSSVANGHHCFFYIYMCRILYSSTGIILLSCTKLYVMRMNGNRLVFNK